MAQPFFLRGDAYKGMEMHAAEAGLHRYIRHSHDEYSVILVTQGAKLLSVERSSFTVEPGQIVVVPPGTSHECEPLKGQHWAHRCWYISPKLVAELTGDRSFLSAPPKIAPVTDDPLLARRLAKAHREASEVRSLVADDMLHRLLATAVRRASSKTATDTGEKHHEKRLKRAQGYIQLLESTVEQPLDLERLAELGGVSRFQVIRDFNAHFHMSPGRALADLRLRRSKLLLRAGLSLTETSAQLGFADQSHFNRSFKAAYGVTPGRYSGTALVRVKT